MTKDTDEPLSEPNPNPEADENDSQQENDSIPDYISEASVRTRYEESYPEDSDIDSPQHNSNHVTDLDNETIRRMVESDKLSESIVEERQEILAESVKNKILDDIRFDIDNLIDEERKSLLELEAEFESRLEELENQHKEITEIRNEATSLREEYSQLVQWEAGDSIGGKLFEERKKKIQESSIAWLIGSFISIFLLIVASGFIYFDISSPAGGTVMISKILLLLPISVAVWFTVTNYSRQRKLMREYEFKEGVSKSMMGFVESFRQSLSDEEEEKIGEFINQTMEKIYSNPQENISDGNSDDSEKNPIPRGAGPSLFDRIFK
jgi:hypothetical protein